MRDEFFTIGGVLARVWRPAYPLLPWALTAALLTVAALWGHWSSGAPVEWTTLGLAAYELMIGLSNVEAASPSDSRALGSALRIQHDPARRVHWPER